MKSASENVRASMRELAHSEDGKLVELVRELQAHELNFFDRMKQPGDIGDWYVTNLRKECAGFGGVILVAQINRDIAGYAAVLTTMTSAEEIDEIEYTYAEVRDLVVAENFRRQGIGTQLLQECKKIARNAGTLWIRITALSENLSAVRAYQNAGFHPLFATFEKNLD